MNINILHSGSDGNCVIVTDKETQPKVKSFQNKQHDFDKFIKGKEFQKDEKWKDIPNTFQTYKISNYGRLSHWTQKNGWNILKITNKKGDYFNIVMEVNGIKISEKIHRLVAKAFIPNPENLKCVNHIDGNKQNNRVSNLEWCTPKQNFIHAKKMGLWSYNHPYKCRKVVQYSLKGEFIREFNNAKEAERITGVCGRNILQVANGEEYNKIKHLKRKQAGGFVWKFNEGGE